MTWSICIQLQFLLCKGRYWSNFDFCIHLYMYIDKLKLLFFLKYQQFLKKQYQQPKSILNKEWNFIPLTRGVHGLGWVGFVPNLDSTWIIRVRENMAQNQPRWSGLIFQFGSRRFWVVSVRYRVSLPGTIFGQILWDLAEI